MIVHRGVKRRGEVVNLLTDLLDRVAMLYYQDKENTNAHVNYFEALTHTLSAFNGNFEMKAMEEKLKEIEKIFLEIDDLDFYEDEIISALLLLEIKALKHVRYPLDLITPDGVAILCGLLVSPLLRKEKEKITVIDPNYGLGNLAHVISYLYPDLDMEWIGIENHQPFVDYACAKADFLEFQLTLHFQDALAYHYPEVDLVVSDLASYDYDTESYHSILADEGINYFPYLLIEKFLDSGNKDTMYFYIIDNDFFQHKGASSFKEFIAKRGHIEAIIALPQNFFLNHSQEKAIMILSKRQTMEETEVHYLPNVNDREQFEQTINKIISKFKEK